MIAGTKLGLGTVQFGLNYGVSNVRGQVTPEKAEEMLALAADGGISLLDTAAAYGNSEAVLGASAQARKFQVATKTLTLKQGLLGVIERARESVRILRRKPELLLVHSAGDLNGPDGPALWSALLDLRDQGLFGAIGISAYAGDNPAALAERYRPAAMQIPVSLLDQRLVADGTLDRLKALDVEVHVRSIFLQGLLFLLPDAIPSKLAAAAPRLEQIRQIIREAGSTPLAAALAFVLQQPAIDKVIVGATDPAELHEIIAASRQTVPVIPWPTCAVKDLLVLTPSLW